MINFDTPNLDQSQGTVLSNTIVPEELKSRMATYFEQPASSSAAMVAKRFFEKHIMTDKDDLDYTDTPEQKEAFKAYVEDKHGRMLQRLKASADDVMSEFEKLGLFVPPPKKKKEKPKEVVIDNRQEVGFKEVELTEAEQQRVEANMLFTELQRINVFKDQEMLNELYEKTDSLEHISHKQGLEYYMQFAGMVPGGEEEIQKDFARLQEIKKKFEESRALLDAETREALDILKKVATLTERALVFGVSHADWYGETVVMSSASEYDDIRGGVDTQLEVRKKGEESDFLGMGIDVTFRGVESPEFKEKFFKLLHSIKDGYKTKIKYGVDYDGEPMKALFVPKVLVHFNAQDIKSLMQMLQADPQTAKETFKDSPQKVKTMWQMVYQCKALSEFAQHEQAQNNVFRRYNAFLSSLKELSWRSQEVKDIFTDAHGQDSFSRHIDNLIAEFKQENKM